MTQHSKYMQEYEVSLKVRDCAGQDPLSALGKMARMLLNANPDETEEEEEEAEGEADTQKTPQKKTSNLAKAMQVFDLHKVDRANQYDDPEEFGERSK